MRWFLKRLYRDRRRLLVVAIFTFLGGVIAFPSTEAFLFGWPFFLVAGLAFMFGLTAFLTLIAVLFPSIRHCAEVAAVNIPFLALLGAFGSSDHNWDGMPTWAFVTGLVVCYLGVTIYSGPALDRFLPQRKKRFVSHAISDLSAEKLWPYFATTPDTPAEFWDDRTISMDWIEPQKTFLIVERMNDIAKVEEVQQIEQITSPSTFKFNFSVPSAAKDAQATSGDVELQLIKDGHETRIQMTRTFIRVPWNRILSFWVDDHFGRIEDGTIRRAETLEAAKV